jgi:rhomboid protease GluP
VDAATTFGRRGAKAPPTFTPQPPPPSPSWSIEAEPQARAPFLSAFPALSLKLPWFTGAVLALLTAIFVLELAVSAQGGHPGRIAHNALLKLGGVSGELVFDRGQWWRVLTAPLLHASWAHLIGNGVALLLVGLLLEPIVGTGWFALIYVLGGFCGALTSIGLNPHGLLSVGASGAIMCVLSSSLVLSLHAASAERRKRMQALSLRVMIPALLPTAGGHGHVDYSAHIGGVVAGLVLGFALQILWDEKAERPPYEGAALRSGVAGGACSLLALGLAAILPTSAVRVGTPGLIPIDDMPTTAKQGAAQAEQLAAQYPADPRALTLLAMAYVAAHNDAAAESELQQALQSRLLTAPELPPKLATSIRISLTALYLKDGQTADARTAAAPLCLVSGEVDPKAMRVIDKAGLCDPN